ncbi:MAG: metal ABC transporter permease [Oscillospiraceae bacterium]|nr:metal ABC transporter permease [Oscillospiraceae bacterium]
MLQFISNIFSYGFAQRALLVGLPVSLCAALLGVSLVLKRYSMIGDGLSHVGFGALCVAAVMNLAPLQVAVPVVAAAAFLLLRISESTGVRGDSAVAMISSVSVAVGLIAASLSKGLNTDVSGYMFGNVLSMEKGDVPLSVALSVTVLLVYVLCYNKIYAVTFDESFARATGVNAGFYNTLIAVLTSVTVVVGMKIMGTALISSLIAFPALTAMRVCRSFKAVTAAAAGVSAVCFFTGLVASFWLETPAGATVVVVSAVGFLGAVIVEKIVKRSLRPIKR